MKSRTTRILRVVALLSIFSVVTGCGMIQPVQPWEKGMLAKPEMNFDSDRLEAKFTEHIYTSKEGASGGGGVGGGGCGCN